MDHSSLKRLPWVSWEEWMSVKETAFADDAEGKKWAIKMMTLWATVDNLPAGICATQELLQCEVFDLDPSIKRTVLANCIIRLVNGLTDPFQKGGMAKSAFSIGCQIQMPLLLIELRHDATHRQLPTLEVLEQGAKQALEFLFNSYWQVQHINLLKREKKINNLLRDLDNHTDIFIADRVRTKLISSTTIVDIFVPMLFSHVLVQKPSGQNGFEFNSAIKHFQSRLAKWKQQLKGLQYVIPSFTVECLRVIYAELSQSKNPWKNMFLCCWHNYLSGKAKELYSTLELKYVFMEGLKLCFNGGILERRWLKQIVDNISITIAIEDTQVFQNLFKLHFSGEMDPEKAENPNFLKDLQKEFTQPQQSIPWETTEIGTVLWGQLNGPEMRDDDVCFVDL